MTKLRLFFVKQFIKFKNFNNKLNAILRQLLDLSLFTKYLVILHLL
jgi:hypothetical protein